MSSAWCGSPPTILWKFAVLLRSTPPSHPQGLGQPSPKPINLTPHPSTQDAPRNPPSHHPPRSRIGPDSATAAAEPLHNRLHPSSSKRNLRHIHGPRDVRSLRQWHLHMQR